jgi:Flp pilus assembly pilin Flp
MKSICRLMRDERGVVASTEIMLLMVILVFGMVAGIVSMRDAVNQEIGDTGLAINNLNQGYSYAGNTIATVGSVNGSEYVDNSDINDGADGAGVEPAGLSLVFAAVAE